MFPILLENREYITPFNSYNFKIGHALYKDGNIELAKKLKGEKKQFNPDIKQVSNLIFNEGLLFSKTLEKEIEKRLLKTK